MAVNVIPATPTPVPLLTNHPKAPTRTASPNDPVSTANQAPTASATLTTSPITAAATPATRADAAIGRRGSSAVGLTRRIGRVISSVIVFIVADRGLAARRTRRDGSLSGVDGPFRRLAGWKSAALIVYRRCASRVPQ